MAEVHQKKVSPTGVVGTILGGTALLGLANGGNGGILPGVFGNNCGNGCGGNCAPTVTFGADADVTPFVTKYESNLIQKNGEQAATIAQLKAEADTSNKIIVALAPVYGKLEKQQEDICELKMAMAMESERRSCGDEKLLTYVDSNFIKAEKSINSKKINYHGVKPTLEITDCCCE